MQRRKKYKKVRDKSIVDVNTLALEQMDKKDKKLFDAIDNSKIEGPFIHFKLSREGLFIGARLSRKSTAGFILTIAGIVVLLKQVLIPLF